MRRDLVRVLSGTNGELPPVAHLVAQCGGADPGRVHVQLNNCYRDYAQVNAQQLAALLQA